MLRVGAFEGEMGRRREDGVLVVFDADEEAAKPWGDGQGNDGDGDDGHAEP